MIALTCQRCAGEFAVDGVGELATNLAARYIRFCEPCEVVIDVASAQIAAEQDRHLIAARVGSLPKIFQRAEWSDNDQRHPQAFEAALRWSKDGGVLALLGPVGTGKSHLAALAAKTAMQRIDIAWISVPSLLLHLTASYGDAERAKAMRAVTGRRALVLDDLDKTSASEWARAQLFAAIDSRITDGTPLIVTANVTRDGMAAKLGDAIASRLIGEGTVCIMSGNDRRLNRKAG